jgi:hypothetical protein
MELPSKTFLKAFPKAFKRLFIFTITILHPLLSSWKDLVGELEMLVHKLYTMKYLLLLLICVASFGCSRAKEPTTAVNPAVVKQDSLAATRQTTSPDSPLNSSLEEIKEDVEQEQIDCVFDTSTYKFTTEALRDYDKNLKFYWNKESSEALVKLPNSDSLILSIGGCNHFGYSATYVMDAAKFNDREFMAQKAKWLAKNFFSNGFDEKYVFCIENNLYQLEGAENKDFLLFTIIDRDTAITNKTYAGWTVEKVGNKARLNLSGYVN